MRTAGAAGRLCEKLERISAKLLREICCGTVKHARSSGTAVARSQKTWSAICCACKVVLGKVAPGMTKMVEITTSKATTTTRRILCGMLPAEPAVALFELWRFLSLSIFALWLVRYLLENSAINRDAPAWPGEIQVSSHQQFL